MIWALDREGTNFRKLNVLKAQHTETINGELSLKINTKEPIKKYETVIFRNSINEWHEFVVKSVNELRDGSEVYLEHSSYELHDHIIRDKRPVDKSVDFILGDILEGTRWSVGTSDILGVFTMNFYYISSFSALKKLIEEVNGEIEYVFSMVDNQVVTRTINIKNKIGEDRGRLFVYSKDMFGVRRTVNEDVITALIGRGRGEEISDGGYGRRLTLTDLDMPDSPLGVDYVEDLDAKNNFGLYFNGQYMHRFGAIEFDDVDDINELYLLTKKLLEIQSTPKITYEVDVAILSNPEDRVGLGDTIHVIDDDFGGHRLTIHGRVLRIVHDLLYPEESEIIIGNLVNDMSYFQNKVENQMNSMRSKTSIWDRANAFNENNQLPASYIADLLAEWNNQANLSGGYTYSFEGMGTITYDRPYDADPTQAVQIVGGTLRIANSKDINGEWVWKTVINAQGIAGQEIITGSITANKLSSDIGESLDLSSNIAIINTVKAIEDIELLPGPSGEDAYKLEIFSTNGNIFKNGSISTTLIARVYQGTVDLTDSYDASLFRWTRHSDNLAEDESWNTSNYGGTKQITIDETDVNVRATFSCQLLNQ